MTSRQFLSFPNINVRTIKNYHSDIRRRGKEKKRKRKEKKEKKNHILNETVIVKLPSVNCIEGNAFCTSTGTIYS